MGVEIRGSFSGCTARLGKRFAPKDEGMRQRGLEKPLAGAAARGLGRGE